MEGRLARVEMKTDWMHIDGWGKIWVGRALGPLRVNLLSPLSSFSAATHPAAEATDSGGGVDGGVSCGSINGLPAACSSLVAHVEVLTLGISIKLQALQVGQSVTPSSF
jgi:hypothetical protein